MCRNEAQYLYKSEGGRYMKRGEAMRSILPSINKGQVSGFTILGIVIVAVIVLLFFLRGQLGQVLPGGLGGKSTDIREHIGDCLREVVPQYLERIGLQGGYLSTPESTFRRQNDIPISYLCYDIEGQ